LPFVLFAAVAAVPREARADGCEGCSGPTVAHLQQTAGLKLERRGDRLIGYARDYLLTDAGECTATLTAPPTVTRECAWLVERGRGEVWHCPHSKSKDTITIEASRTDSTRWTLKVTSAVKLKAVVAQAMLEVENGRSEGVAIREVTRVSKTITPGYCRRIRWLGYFEVGKFTAEATFKFTQRWAWWTKNRKTGAKVHQSGDVHMDCGTGAVELGRQAPIAGYFDLTQGACEASKCGSVVAKHLGFFPPLPPYLPDPHADDPPAPKVVEDDDEPEVPHEPMDPPPSSDELGDPPAASDDLGDPPTGPLPDPLAPAEETR
jgi:hypothetical protein